MRREWIPCRSDHPDVGPCTLEHDHDGPHAVVVRHTHTPQLVALATWAVAPHGRVWIVAV
jgi:hypothetical protein